VSGNVNGVMSLMDPSFHQVGINGDVMNCDQMRKTWETMKATVKDAKARVIVNELHAYGDEVSAWVTVYVDFKMKQGSKWVQTSYKGKYVECLRKTAEGWKFIHSNEVREF
jgi:ketosteroid isomerase-like protein